jgi:glycosyltransferase involved in cell wall biosynthesis
MTPTHVPKFTYVIPFRFRQDRILPLRRIVDWLSGFQGIEIMIIEQDKHSMISHLNIKANHIFIKSEAPFNKSWAYNVAIRRSASQVILFGDADFIMDPMQLIECLKELDSCDCVIPTDKVKNLNQQESAMDTASIVKLTSLTPKRNMMDGLSIFKKDSIMKIAGWNEDMMGVGFENEFNELKIKQNLNFKQMNYTGYHIFHHTDITPPQLLQRNQQIFDTYKNDANLLNQHISSTLPKIGAANRFSSFIG